MAIESDFGFIGFVFVPDYVKNGEKKTALFAHFYEIANGEGTQECEPFTAIKVVNQGDDDEMRKLRDWYQKVKTFDQGQTVKLRWKPGRGNTRYDVQEILSASQAKQEQKSGGIVK